MDAADLLANSQGELTVYQQCVKFGDFSLFEFCPELTRQDLKNADFLTVHPEDLVNIEVPDEKWKPYWLLDLPGNTMSFKERHSLRGMGYQLCNHNEGFRSATFEMREDGVFHYGPLVLYIQPLRKYRQAQAERSRPAAELVDASRNAFHAAAEEVSSVGIGSFEAESSDDGPLHRKGPGGDDIDQSNFRTVVRAGT